MKQLLIVNLIVMGMMNSIIAQDSWPKVLTHKDGGSITVYQPQPEKLNGNNLVGRAAFSVKVKPSDEPAFGVFWYNAKMETDRDKRMMKLDELDVTEVRLPGVDDTTKLNLIKTFVEVELTKGLGEISIDKILASIEEEQQVVSEDLKTDPPKIIFTKKLSALVLIDGEPKVKKDDNMNMERVINSAYLIVKNPDDKKYYLYYGGAWYRSSEILKGWESTKKLTKTIEEMDKFIKKKEKEAQANSATQEAATSGGKPREIIVSTVPAELIQSNGEPDFKNVTGTSLLYMSNSEDNIFMETNGQKYYVLLSGRWYNASKLEGPWQYIASDKLPPDFAKIPEGSEKDAVLSSVAGTQAAKEAVMDAQVPQTAKVDRKKATCTVKYDGEPKFEKIEGTELYLAVNTSSTVLREDKTYYCVENGVWFKSSKATGPWAVSEERPKDTDKIPASSPANNVKYVYIYESTPEVVYVGYTPAYMGTYVYGPTVVYGTGYYYSPWYGPYYYPRPVTFGFSMNYNPWTGWSMGFHVSSGPFHFSFYGGGYGGYWGCPAYRPPYYPPYRGGYYGGNRVNHYGNTTINNINIGNTNNIYNRRDGVSTNDRPRAGTGGNRGGGATSSQLPANRPANANRPTTSDRPANNVYADRNGNVYQKDNEGWKQRDNNQWKQSSSASQMDRQQEMRDRGNQRTQNFQSTNRGGNMGGSYNRASSRPSGGARGGGGGRRR